LGFFTIGLYPLSTGKIGKVPLSYLVCATERSGSTLLCELLSGTGVAGRPEEFFEFLSATGRPRQPREYFLESPEIAERLPPLLAPLPQPAWEDRLADARERGSTPNGVFGAKMMWAYLEDFLSHGDPEAQLGTPLEWVHVEREDTLKQAVSLWRAVQTSQWRADERSGDERAARGRSADHAQPVFDAAAIDHLKRRLEDHTERWRRWFAEGGIEPLRIGYEAFTAEPHATVCRVLEHLGLPTDVPIPDPPMRRQSDGLSAEWAERYREEVPA
jgi:trehalose 2-sulfotransferase